MMILAKPKITFTTLRYGFPGIILGDEEGVSNVSSNCSSEEFSTGLIVERTINGRDDGTMPCLKTEGDLVGDSDGDDLPIVTVTVPAPAPVEITVGRREGEGDGCTDGKVEGESLGDCEGSSPPTNAQYSSLSIVLLPIPL